MAVSSCSILPRSAPYVDCIRLGCEPEGASLPAAGQGLRRGANPSLPSISVGCSLWRQRNGIEGTGKERKEKETSSSVHRPPAALAHAKHTIACLPDVACAHVSHSRRYTEVCGPPSCGALPQTAGLSPGSQACRSPNCTLPRCLGLLSVSTNLL